MMIFIDPLYTSRCNLLYCYYFYLLFFVYLRKIFFDEHTGHVKKVGETYKLTKLGETMRVLSKEGSDALYNGSLTSQFVEDLRKVNGIITEEDLSNYV